MIGVYVQNIKILFSKGYVEKSNISLKVKINEIVCTLLLSLITSVTTIIVSVCLLKVLNIPYPINRTNEFIVSNGAIFSIISYIFYIPLIEELGFRLGLKYSRINFSIMTSCLSYFFLIIIHFSISEYFKSMNSYFTNILIALLFGIVTLFILTFSQKTDSFLTDFWSNHRKQVFYFSVFLFGVFHYFNFELNFKTLLLMPLITLPQTIYGIVFGYIRLKYGIFYSVLSHSLLNMVAFIPAFLDYIK